MPDILHEDRVVKHELYRTRKDKHWDAVHEARSRGLTPTAYFVEYLDYHDRAKALQDRNLGLKPPEFRCGDDLQDHVTIYDNVERRLAGFSNVLESVWYGPQAPKVAKNIAAGRDTTCYKDSFDQDTWLYLFLIHRLTGSGASFEHDHGWRNSIVPYLCHKTSWIRPSNGHISNLIASYDKPIFTSIGNQIPPFNKPNPPYATGGKEFLCEHAPKLAVATLHWLQQGPRKGIKETVDWILSWMTQHGFKRYKFVLTAFAMDIAEYMPDYVDPNSDVYHGKNAEEAMELIFNLNPSLKSHKAKYDTATRVICDLKDTWPMDTEDVMCDAIRWSESYIPKRSYDHLDRSTIFSSISLRHHKGRQPS